MENFVIKNRKTGTIVNKTILSDYVFPVSATPQMQEIQQIANFQKEISKKYYKEPKKIDDEEYNAIVFWILNYYEVPDK